MEPAIGDPPAQVDRVVLPLGQDRVEGVFGDELLGQEPVVGLYLHVLVVLGDVDLPQVGPGPAVVPLQPGHAQQYIHFDIHPALVLLVGREPHHTAHAPRAVLPIIFLLFVEDGGLEFVQLVPQVLGDVGDLVEQRDRHALASVVDYDQGAGFLQLI